MSDGLQLCGLSTMACFSSLERQENITFASLFLGVELAAGKNMRFVSR